jgi:hypothetical protein
MPQDTEFRLRDCLTAGSANREATHCLHGEPNIHERLARDDQWRNKRDLHAQAFLKDELLAGGDDRNSGADGSADDCTLNGALLTTDNPADDAAGDCAAADLEHALLRVSGHPETERFTGNRIAIAAHRELVETKGYLRSARDATRGVDMRYIALDDGAGRNDSPAVSGDWIHYSQRDLVSDMVLVGGDARL